MLLFNEGERCKAATVGSIRATVCYNVISGIAMTIYITVYKFMLEDRTLIMFVQSLYLLYLITNPTIFQMLIFHNKCLKRKGKIYRLL